MHELIDNAAAAFCLISAGVFFLCGLLTGAWKYAHIARSPTATAPVYVDIAHRASLLYSFASILLAHFAALSAWSPHVNLIAAALPIVFFAAAIGGYVLHGLRRDTDNQFLNPMPGLHFVMWLLMAAEIGGFVVLFAGVIANLHPAR